MTIQELISAIANNGIGIVCVAFLIYFQSTTMKDMGNTLKEIVLNLQTMNERLNNLEEKIEKRNDKNEL